MCWGSTRSTGLSLGVGGTGQGMAQPKEGSGVGVRAGAAAFPDPWAPVWEPAATAAARSITDLIRQLQQPAGARCRPGAPPPHLRKGWG